MFDRIGGDIDETLNGIHLFNHRLNFLTRRHCLFTSLLHLRLDPFLCKLFLCLLLQGGRLLSCFVYVLL